MRGKWRIVKVAYQEGEYTNTTGPACIEFDGEGGGEFAFDCVTGSIYESGDGDAVEFGWSGNDEMDEARGDGWVELQDDGSVIGKICFDRGDDVDFIARRWTTTSTRR